MRNELNLTLPWKRFRDFIAPEADRRAILGETLTEAGLDFKLITIAGSRHFFITPPRQEEDISRPRLTVLTAHYDRSPGSPGANDNSAAVFILIETAMKLKEYKTANWLVIFTDKEELAEGESIRDQGSYTLAMAFQNRLEGARIFNFDVCGTGDSLIISTTAEYLMKTENRPPSEKLRASLLELKEYALETARNLSLAKVLLLPMPFSDDAGFLLAGTAAQTITMLPSQEANSLVSTLRREPRFADVLLSLDRRSASTHRLLPETWRVCNSPSDSHLRLSPRNFPIVRRFAEALCKY